jgi:ABC-2 type transport system permease protein
MFKRVYPLIIKEFIAVWQDKRSRLMLIMPPMIQLFIFAFAATLEVKNISIAVLNRDYGKESYELVRRFQGSTYFKKINYINSPNQIREVIDNQKAIMVIQFDEQFSRNLLAGKPAEVQIILDGRKSNTAQIVLGYASKIIYQYNVERAQEEGFIFPKSVIIPRNWYNPNLEYIWFTVPGLVALLTMTTALLVTSLTIARERELGTFDQLLVSPLNSIDILLGKAIPGVIIGMGEGIIILLFAIFAFQIPFTGSILALFFALFVFVCSIIGVGLFLSSLCNTQQQALLAVFVFLSNAVTLSGFATPIENMPIWLQKITYINPLRFMLIIARGSFLKDLPWRDIITNLYPIIIVAIFNLSLAGWFFRKKLE